MLVLARKKGERVFLGDGIVVTVLDVGRRSVRLGFTAPAELPVHREEVRLRAAAKERRTQSVKLETS